MEQKHEPDIFKRTEVVARKAEQADLFCSQVLFIVTIYEYMPKIEKLTKKQEALIPLIRQEWIDLVSSGKEIDKKAVTN